MVAVGNYNVLIYLQDAGSDLKLAKQLGIRSKLSVNEKSELTKRTFPLDKADNQVKLVADKINQLNTVQSLPKSCKNVTMAGMCI